MKAGPLKDKASLPLTFLDGVCDRFEAACKAAGASGLMPSPEAYLEQAPETMRPELLRELSKREFTYRQRRVKMSKILNRLSAKLAPLKFLDLIGRGGMGKVYKAQDVQGQIVAVKLLPQEFSQDKERGDRFEREAEVLSRIKHDNIIALRPIRHFDDGNGLSYFMDKRDGLAYFVMEYAEGGSLRTRITQNGVSPSDAIGIVLQVCKGLQHAHEADVIHRDIKPENILIDRQGQMKIADFGLAKVLDSVQTKTSQVMGTPAYMAPEQERATSKVDRRADIYSLGVVFYELLTGSRPPNDCPPDPPSQKRSVGKWLDDVVLRALANNPDDRFQEVGDLINAIDLGPFLKDPIQRNEQPRLFG